MSHIRFNDSKAMVNCEVSMSGSIATLRFKEAVIVDTSGFRVYLDKEGEYDIGGSSYMNFKTIYRNDEETAKYNGYQLSNDGSVYVVPLPEITFAANYGGELSGDLTQSVADYKDLVVPMPKANHGYGFEKWQPEIPKRGSVKQSETFTAMFKSLPQVSFFAVFGGELSGEATQYVSDYADLKIPTPIPDVNYEFTKWEPEIPTSGKVEEYKSYTATFTKVETLEEAKQRKIAEMNAAQQEVIKRGVEVTLTNGTVERFTLKDQDQLSLMGLQVLAERGDNKIPWHDADNAQHCKYYTAEDVKKITAAAMTLISFHVTFYRDLRIYINSMTDKASVEAATYGMHIPTEYQSEVLRDFYAAQDA